MEQRLTSKVANYRVFVISLRLVFMMMKSPLRSWGNYPKIYAKLLQFSSNFELKNLFSTEAPFVIFGNGRSYGDSALNQTALPMLAHHFFLGFDSETGVLEVQAGARLSEILEIFIPRGWFLKITPGTKHVTVGGAIASDVHGLNHHKEGCFSASVVSFRLMHPSGEILTCSSTQNPDLFKATCGGMGLTGVVLDAKITLKKIRSNRIEQTIFKTQNLQETLDAFEAHREQSYMSAWIDTLAKPSQLGKGLFRIGDFCSDGVLDYSTRSRGFLPFFFPSLTLNKLTIKLFNFFYYHRIFKKKRMQLVNFNTFFYPLDGVGNLNRIYGKQGFTQYHVVLPKELSFSGLEALLKEIKTSGIGSVSAVLQKFGAENENYLSFPLEGFSLSVDFKIQAGLFALLDRLDQIVLQHGGRFYLAKDARVRKAVFEAGYPRLEMFRALRKTYQVTDKLQSLQSVRLEL